MKQVSLKRSKTEQKGPEVAKNIARDEFSYGTRVSLGKDELKNLGMKPSDFEIGSTFELEATVKVTRVSASQSDDYNSADVELQITHIGLEAADSGVEDAIGKAIEEAGEDA